MKLQPFWATEDSSAKIWVVRCIRIVKKIPISFLRNPVCEKMGQTESHLEVSLKVAGGMLKTNVERFMADGLPLNHKRKSIR